MLFCKNVNIRIMTIALTNLIWEAMEEQEEALEKQNAFRLSFFSALDCPLTFKR